MSIPFSTQYSTSVSAHASNTRPTRARTRFSLGISSRFRGISHTPMSSKFKAYFSPFLTLQEAEALDNGDSEHVACASEGDAEAENLVPVWRTLVLSFTALFETLLWSAAAAYTFIVAPDGAWAGPVRLSVLIACIALTWVYAAYRPVVRPQPTAPYDLFALYVVHLAVGILLLGGVVYSNISDTQRAPSRQGPILVGLVVNLVAILVLLGVVVNMPMGIPSDRVQASDVVRLSSFTSSFLISETFVRAPWSPLKTTPPFGTGYPSPGSTRSYERYAGSINAPQKSKID